MPFPVEMKWILESERKLGVKFPASFVSSMTAQNGGSIQLERETYELFPFFDASDRKRIQRTCNSIERETMNARKKRDRFPGDAVAIGANSGGDLLVLLSMPDHPNVLQHSIYVWDHETSELIQVADDFRDVRR